MGRELHLKPRISRDLLAAVTATKIRELTRSRPRGATLAVFSGTASRTDSAASGNRTLDSPEEAVILPFPKKANVVRHEHLGGLLKSYTGKAA